LVKKRTTRKNKKRVKPKTESELRQALANEADTDEVTDIDDLYCNLVYFFQKELGITITEDYSVARFNVLKDEAVKENERIQKQQLKDSKKTINTLN